MLDNEGLAGKDFPSMAITSLLVIWLGTTGPGLGSVDPCVAAAAPAVAFHGRGADPLVGATLENAGQGSARMPGLSANDGAAVVEEEDSADDLESGLQNHAFMSAGPPSGQMSHLRPVRGVFRSSARSALLRC